jgi:hypothetical protein
MTTIAEAQQQAPSAVVGTQADHWIGGSVGETVIPWQRTGEQKMVMLLKDLPIGTLLYTHPSTKDAARYLDLQEAAQSLVDGAVNGEAVWPGHLKDLRAALEAIAKEQK